MKINGFELILQPDEDDGEAIQVLVDGKIGGNIYRFLLDTGAAKTSMVFDAYTAAFPSVGKNKSSGVFAERTDDLITVPSIEFGSISKNDFTLARHAGKNPELGNLIGMDLLKDFCCRFLFDEKIVRVDPVDPAGSGAADQDILFDEKHHPYIPVQFGAVRAQAVWDTGAGVTIADTGFIEKHPGLFQEIGRSSGTDSTGTRMETPMFIMAKTIIGGYEFPPHKAAGVDLALVNATPGIPMDLILGYTTIGKANWLFDFPRRKWAVLKLLDV